MRALAIVVASAALGAAYIAYISAVSFPPAAVRVVPLVWLLAAVVGGVLAAQSMRADGRRAATVAALVVAVPSVLLAGLFSFGALMGD